MGTINQYPRVKLIIGFIFNKQVYFVASKGILEKKFGRIDFESKAHPFIHTNYYQKELGDNLQRVFVSFKPLIKPENLPKIKIFTNRLEQKLSKENKRQINIDPGYLSLSKLILATTKDHKHRIYLSNNIIGEVTLFYQKGSFNTWDWTYPDYKTDAYIQIFNQIRKIYVQQINLSKHIRNDY